MNGAITQQISNLISTTPKIDELEGRSVLITGGAGFLGSWMCDLLLAAGCSVTCIDNFATGRQSNIDHLASDRFNFLKMDIARFQSIDKKFDYILHFASRASPEEYQMHPIETMDANSIGTRHMLELARKHDATILYTSTSEIYGDSHIVPTPETYWGNVNPVGVRSCYDEAKRFGEALCMSYFRQHGLNVKIVRIFNTYGPRIRADGAYARAIPRFCSQALSGKEMTVFGDGTQTRSFCYVSDTIKGIISMTMSPKTKGEIINIGNNNEITILELAQKIKMLAESNSPISFKSLPEDDPKRRCPDISKAAALLRWSPTISLEEGLKVTIEWFKNHR